MASRPQAFLELSSMSLFRLNIVIVILLHPKEFTLSKAPKITKLILHMTRFTHIYKFDFVNVDQKLLFRHHNPFSLLAAGPLARRGRGSNSEK